MFDVMFFIIFNDEISLKSNSTGILSKCKVNFEHFCHKLSKNWKNPSKKCHLPILDHFPLSAALIDLRQPIYSFLSYLWVGTHDQYIFLYKISFINLNLPILWANFWICVTSKCQFFAIFSPSRRKISHCGL